MCFKGDIGPFPLLGPYNHALSPGSPSSVSTHNMGSKVILHMLAVEGEPGNEAINCRSVGTENISKPQLPRLQTALKPKV